MEDVPRLPDALGKIIDLLNSGGDCAGLNAVICGVVILLSIGP